MLYGVPDMFWKTIKHQIVDPEYDDNCKTEMIVIDKTEKRRPSRLLGAEFKKKTLLPIQQYTKT